MATVPSRTCCQKKCHFTWKYFVRLVMRWFTAKKRAVIVFEDLTLYRRRERARKFDAGGDFLKHGAEGKSVRIAELRAEYSASSVDKKFHFGGETTKWDIHRA
ncbi:hypothetical protein MHU86_8451 [Fragilaria crotonensis]|nr:hypothetical protein MHU86_8451 [Fragilaria crotonensis]